MPRFGSSPFAFPDFKGATRRLILINLAAYFVLLLATLASSSARAIASSLVFDPSSFMHGALWQPLTYSFVHVGIIGTLFELLSLWFLAGFLEAFHNANWVTSLYAVSVLGTAAAALVLYLVANTLAPSLLVNVNPLFGCFGGIFGLLAAIGLLYGDTQFLLFFVIGIKARYLVIIYALVAVAMLFGQERMYAFAQLGGAVAGLAFVRMAPRRHAHECETGDGSAQLREGIHPFLAKEHGDGNERVNDHQVARLDSNDKEQKKLRVAIKEPNSRQQSEDSAKTSEERVDIDEQGGSKRVRDQIEHQRGRGCSQNGNRVEARNPVGIVKRLEEPGEKPQGEQLEKRANNSDVHKAVGEGLP